MVASPRRTTPGARALHASLPSLPPRTTPPNPPAPHPSPPPRAHHPTPQVRQEAPQVFVVVSHWASVPAFERWSLSAECRRHHLPSGIYQFMPRRGEGFPEDFVPIKDPPSPATSP